MSAHTGYFSAGIVCGTCGHIMALSQQNRPVYAPGKPIRYVVTCGNDICPHVGIAYQVEPQVFMREIRPVEDDDGDI